MINCFITNIFVTKKLVDYIKSTKGSSLNSFEEVLVKNNITTYFIDILKTICIHFVPNTYGLFFCRSPPVT